MNIKEISINKLTLTNLDRLDPINVYAEDLGVGVGKITITCYGKAWTAYWGAMGDNTIKQFFVSCDEFYIAKNLSDIDSEVYDIDKIRDDANEKKIECWRDDPWNDYDFLTEMYGNDPVNWQVKIPKMANHEYEYLRRIIKAIQEAFKLQGD